MTGEAVNWTLEILKIAPTLIVGLIAVRIAWQQAETAKQQREVAEAKLKLDLFNRRLAVFEATCNLQEGAARYKDQKQAMQAIKKIITLGYEASFLFGPEVAAFMTELCTKVSVLGSAIRATSEAGGKVPAEILPNLVAANAWIEKAPVLDVFKPYLEFSRWR